MGMRAIPWVLYYTQGSRLLSSSFFELGFSVKGLVFDSAPAWHIGVVARGSFFWGIRLLTAECSGHLPKSTIPTRIPVLLVASLWPKSVAATRPQTQFPWGTISNGTNSRTVVVSLVKLRSW